MIAVRYHDETKHHFGRFSRSLGYLDWATQPDPFRRYEGATVRQLPRVPVAREVAYSALYDDRIAPVAISDETVGELLRCSMGLSAWKQYGRSRWALRVNPSSGNLHPTEAWIVYDRRVCHYLPGEHALETRCLLPSLSLRHAQTPTEGFLVALTSIVWREAWKYGERAFRYCQHDVGHAIASLRFAAAMLGWRLCLLPQWSDAQVASLLGLDRDEDFAEAEPEEPACLALVSAGRRDALVEAAPDPTIFVEAARSGEWFGRANALSSQRVEWPLIDEAVRATRRPPGRAPEWVCHPTRAAAEAYQAEEPAPGPLAREIILQRRSALAFDPRGALRRERLLSMLARLHHPRPPWDVADWEPHVNLVLFVHRVVGLSPGIYAYLRDPTILEEWQPTMRPDFLWEPIDSRPDRLFLLAPLDVGQLAKRLSCDQAIAEDGFFALAMLARFEEPLRLEGGWFYRRLFWECGLIGQVLYLEAEAAGARATGIGCYYDDQVHQTLGLSGHAWQSLYHLSMGTPLEDTRLTTEPGYPWEHEMTALAESLRGADMLTGP